MLAVEEGKKQKKGPRAKKEHEREGGRELIKKIWLAAGLSLMPIKFVAEKRNESLSLIVIFFTKKKLFLHARFVYQRTQPRTVWTMKFTKCLLLGLLIGLFAGISVPSGTR